MYTYSSIQQYHAQIKLGQTTCLQAVRHYIQNIEQQKHLNAFVEVYSHEALKRAAELDALPAEAPKGKLHGVVIGIKDVICYKDHQVTASSNILKGFTSLYSATAVQRLVDEGAIIIGRQNCDEFGMGSTNENSAYGPALNPINNNVVPGGSSGGSAISVKAGLCMASIGTDTGGSVRLPADFCGIVGMKPTYGRISRHGLIAYASSFDQMGILALNVADAALILEVIAGADEFDSTVSKKEVNQYYSALNEESSRKYKIAYFPEWLEHPSVDPEISDQIKSLLSLLKEKGHEPAPVHFPLTEYIVPTYYILTTAEASSNLSRYDGVRYGYQNKKSTDNLTDFYKQNRSQGFGKEVKRRIMLGTFVLSAGYYDAYFTKAQRVRRLLQQQTESIFKNFDIILAPTSPTTAYQSGEKIKDPLAMYMGDIFTVFANLAGIPAAGLPLFNHSNTLPFGIQVMANRFDEVSLLRFSHQLMSLQNLNF